MNKVERRQCIRRTGWTDGLTGKEVSVPGARLMQMLLNRANQEGLQLRELAAKLEITPGYLHQLRIGHKPIAGISNQLIDNIRIFLDVPKVSVLLAAGIVRVEDFYEDAGVLSVYVRQGIDFIRRDPHWGALVPVNLVDPKEDLLMLIIRLYESATGRKILPEKRICAIPFDLSDLVGLS